MKGKTTASPYLSVAEVAAHFHVSVATIRQRRGLFAELQHVRTAPAGARGRVLIVRASVEALDARLQQPTQPAQSASDGLRLVKKRA
jgi:hypothetical protein